MTSQRTPLVTGSQQSLIAIRTLLHQQYKPLLRAVLAGKSPSTNTNTYCKSQNNSFTFRIAEKIQDCIKQLCLVVFKIPKTGRFHQMWSCTSFYYIYYILQTSNALLGVSMNLYLQTSHCAAITVFFTCAQIFAHVHCLHRVIWRYLQIVAGNGNRDVSDGKQ